MNEIKHICYPISEHNLMKINAVRVQFCGQSIAVYTDEWGILHMRSVNNFRKITWIRFKSCNEFIYHCTDVSSYQMIITVRNNNNNNNSKGDTYGKSCGGQAAVDYRACPVHSLLTWSGGTDGLTYASAPKSQSRAYRGQLSTNSSQQ